MNLIEVGHVVLNLEYLILAEDGAREPEPRTVPRDVLRVTVAPGRVLDLRGDDADRVRRRLGEILSPPPTTIRLPVHGKPVDPAGARPTGMRCKPARLSGT